MNTVRPESSSMTIEKCDAALNWLKSTLGVYRYIPLRFLPSGYSPVTRDLILEYKYLLLWKSDYYKYQRYDNIRKEYKRSYE